MIWRVRRRLIVFDDLCNSCQPDFDQHFTRIYQANLDFSIIPRKVFICQKRTVPNSSEPINLIRQTLKDVKNNLRDNAEIFMRHDDFDGPFKNKKDES